MWPPAGQQWAGGAALPWWEQAVSVVPAQNQRPSLGSRQCKRDAFSSHTSQVLLVPSRTCPLCSAGPSHLYESRRGGRGARAVVTCRDLSAHIGARAWDSQRDKCSQGNSNLWQQVYKPLNIPQKPSMSFETKVRDWGEILKEDFWSRFMGSTPVSHTCLGSGVLVQEGAGPGRDSRLPVLPPSAGLRKRHSVLCSPSPPWAGGQALGGL